MQTTVTAPHKSVLSGGGKASLSLPSPTSSNVSETSDYQRSTPSPKNSDENGSLMQWPSTSSSSGRCHSNSSSSRDDSDAGFSENLPTSSNKMVSTVARVPSNLSLTAQLRCVRRRRSTITGAGEQPNTSSEVVVVDDPRMTLQRVRVELEKIPSGMGKRRRHSDVDAIKDDGDAKRAKTDNDSEMKPPPPSLPLSDSRMILYAALRKEKLDQVLNLKANSVQDMEEIKVLNDKTEKVDLKQSPLDLKHARNSTDLFLLSQLKQLNKDAASLLKEDVKDESSPPSSVPATPNSDDGCFSKPADVVLRFPVQNNRLQQQSDKSLSQQQQQQQQQESQVVCKWEGCTEERLESEGKLLDHIRLRHTDTQNPEDKDDDFVYKCLWVGCKVFGKGSSSRSWLEKHVAGHSGGKPFQCIVDGCKLRFGTRSLLERHVNGHFKNAVKSSFGCQGGDGEDGGGGGGVGNSSHHHHHPSAPPPAAVRQLRRAGKRMKFRKTIYSARIFDLFDIGVMAQVREKLSLMEKNCKDLSDCLHRDEVRFTSRIIARRKATREEVEEQEEAKRNSSAKVAASTRSKKAAAATNNSSSNSSSKDDHQPDIMILQRWIPENILPDTWCSIKNAQPTRTVKVRSLPHPAKAALSSFILDTPCDCDDDDSECQKRAPRKTKHPLPKGERLS